MREDGFSERFKRDKQFVIDLKLDHEMLTVKDIEKMAFPVYAK